MTLVLKILTLAALLAAIHEITVFGSEKPVPRVLKTRARNVTPNAPRCVLGRFKPQISPDWVRLRALAVLESGENDEKVGQAGEIGEFQVCRRVWRAYTKLPYSAARNPFTSANVVWAIMASRTRGEVSDYEWALTYHSPGRLSHPDAEEQDYAARFVNLCGRLSLMP